MRSTPRWCSQHRNHRLNARGLLFSVHLRAALDTATKETCMSRNRGAVDQQESKVPYYLEYAQTSSVLPTSMCTMRSTLLHTKGG